MFSYGRVRSAFAFAFPLLLGVLYLIAGQFLLDHHQRQRNLQQHKDLLHKASILSARVKSEYSTSQQIQNAFRQVIDRADAMAAQNLFSPEKDLAPLITDHLSPEALERCRVWAFTAGQNNFVLCTGEGLMQSKKRAMEKAFSSLVDLADKESDDGRRRSGEKFIAGLFGENSAPEYLASQRQGKLTPVNFEGHPHYVYWQRLGHEPEKSGGFIALIQGGIVENTRWSIGHLASKLAEEAGSELLITFPGSPLVDLQFAPIIPRQYNRNSQKFKIAMHSLAAAINGADRVPLHRLLFNSTVWQSIEPYLNSLRPRQILSYSPKFTGGQPQGSHGILNHLQMPMRQLYVHKGWWHYLDSISPDTHYYVAISGEAGDEPKKTAKLLLPALTVFTLIWSAVFFLRLRHSRFSLGFAFRILFFMTGMLPVFAFAVLGLNLVDQSHEAAVQKSIAQAYAMIEQIDEKAEGSIAQTSLNIKELLARRALHEGLVSPDYQMRRQTFSQIRKLLRQKGSDLNYLLMIRPGEMPEYHVSSPAYLPGARYYIEYYAISAAAINQLLTSHDPGLPQIQLSASQKNLLKSLGGPSNPSSRDVFLTSLDRVNNFQTGTAGRHLFYSAILEDEGKISCYLVFGLGTAETVLEVIKKQLDSLNSEPSRHFFCFSRDYSTGQKVFPAADRFINSTSGRRFTRFLESAASSLFRLELRQPDEIFLYEPLNKVRHYFGGAVLSLNALNGEKDLKILLLTIMTALLTSTIYLLASAVSSLMINPARQLSKVFSEISAGNYDRRFVYPFRNELGQLAQTTDQMLQGLKERRLLGKFVSTTFDAGVKLSHQHASGQKISGTVLFSDIRSFTTISESHPAEEIGELLNTHLREMVEIINRNSGRIEQFIGDAIVAFFPGENSFSCPLAVKAAMEMTSRHSEIQLDRTHQNKVTYRIGIGLDHGTVMAGILHSGSRSEFTVIGPARSNAEHCETMSKQGRYTRIMATRSVVEADPSLTRAFFNHEADLFELQSLDVTI